MFAGKARAREIGESKEGTNSMEVHRLWAASYNYELPGLNYLGVALPLLLLLSPLLSSS